MDRKHQWAWPVHFPDEVRLGIEASTLPALWPHWRSTHFNYSLTGNAFYIVSSGCFYSIPFIKPSDRLLFPLSSSSIITMWFSVSTIIVPLLYTLLSESKTWREALAQCSLQTHSMKAIIGFRFYSYLYMHREIDNWCNIWPSWLHCCWGQ